MFIRSLWSLLSLFLVFALSCADANNSLLDEARFLLDDCIPSDSSTLAKCTAVVTKMDELQLSDPTNIEAAVLESSANLGLAGLSSLSLAAELAGLNLSSEEDFIQFNNYINNIEATNGRAIDLDALENSKTVLVSALAGVTPAADNKHAFYQLGMLQSVDSFIRPTRIAGTSAINAGDIDETVTASVLADFLGGDTNLILSDTDDTAFLTPVRKSYYRCALQTPLGATAGFTEACLRDLMRCTMSGSAVPEQDYDGDGDADLTDCGTVRTPAALDACEGVDTTETVTCG